MDRKNEADKLFAELLRSGKSWPEDFAAFCFYNGVDFKRSDNAVYESFGMCGDELLIKLQGDSIVIAI